jgi:hypothetical protein
VLDIASISYGLIRIFVANGSHEPAWRSKMARYLNGYLKNLIEAIADAKLRRMRRELELRGIRLDQLDEAWIASSRRDASRGE